MTPGYSTTPASWVSPPSSSGGNEQTLSSLGGTASRRQGRVESAGSGLRAGLQKEWGEKVWAFV